MRPDCQKLDFQKMNAGNQEMNLKGKFEAAELDHHKKVRQLLDRISLLQAQNQRDVASYGLQMK